MAQAVLDGLDVDAVAQELRGLGVPELMHDQVGEADLVPEALLARRLKSDYRYSKENVYNCFVWPDAGGTQRMRIEKAAQRVLDARVACGGMTHAQMYDPKNEGILAPLMDAHDKLDCTVAEAYGISYDGLGWEQRETLSATHLFKLYAEKATQQ